MKISKSIPFAALLALASFLPLACDSSKSQASDESILTNYQVNIAPLIAQEGMPDSMVVVTTVNGSVDTIRPDLSKYADGVVRVPIDVAEGSKIEVTYKVYKSGGVIAAGQQSWTSGDAPVSPRPNLAPRISIDSLSGSVRVDSIVVVRSGAPYLFHTKSSDDKENGLSALLVDWNGDGAMDDSIVPPKGRDSISLTWSTPGTYRISALVRDVEGLTRSDTFWVRVVPKAKISLSSIDTTTPNDSNNIRVVVKFDDSTLIAFTHLRWSIPGSDTFSTPVVESLKVAWPGPGQYTVVVRTIDPLGESWKDSVKIVVDKDVPVLTMELPKAVDVGGLATIRLTTRQRVDSIVSWGFDFDGDTTGGRWDTVGTGRMESIQHVFAKSGNPRVLSWVEDEDGNRAYASGDLTVNASQEGALVNLVSKRDTVVSIEDTAWLRFAVNFPDSTIRNRSRMEWTMDGKRQSDGAIVAFRTFVWSEAGRHVIRWRVVTPSGSTVEDSVVVVVKTDAPVIDLSDLPSDIDKDALVSFRPTFRDTLGRVVRWGVSFGDTARGWDSIVTGATGSAGHIFASTGKATISFFAQDDDGNRTVATKELTVQTGASRLLALKTVRDQSASIGDTMRVRLQQISDASVRGVSRIEWTIDGAAPETLSLDTLRSFMWPTPGTHVVITRLVGPLGATSPDTTTFRIVLDPPLFHPEVLLDTAWLDQPATWRLDSLVTRTYGQISSWKVDFDGDTTGGWDTTFAAPQGGKMVHVFSKVGDYPVLFGVKDDDGNAGVWKRTILVRKGIAALVARDGSSSIEQSIGDVAVVRLKVDRDALIATGSVLEWKIDSGNVLSTNVDSVEQRLSWSEPGTHVVRFRAKGVSGATAWDSTTIAVLLDAPVVSLDSLPRIVGVNILANFSVGVADRFGRIVSWKIDFDGDTTESWDSIGTGTLPRIVHVFAELGNPTVRVSVTDDDGNVVTASKVIPVVTGGLALVSMARTSLVSSIGDRNTVQLNLGFPTIEVQKQYTMEWSVDNEPTTSGPVDSFRVFTWSVPGTHVVRVRSFGDAGNTPWDSTVITVLQAVPFLDVSGMNAPGQNVPTRIQASAKDSIGTLVRWRMDFDADTANGWDTAGTDFVKQATGWSIIPGAMHIFGARGAAKVLVSVEDDDGNIVVMDTTLQVIPANPANSAALYLVSARNPQVTLGDAVAATLGKGPSFPSDLYTMEWTVDGGEVEHKDVDQNLSRSFSWSSAGTHVVRWRALGPLGNTGWDSLVALVVTDAPTIDPLGKFPVIANRNAVSVFDIEAREEVLLKSWRVDFDGDSTNGWSYSGTTFQGHADSVWTLPRLRHIFPALGTHKVLISVKDDDNNVVVVAKDLLVSNSVGSEALVLTTTPRLRDLSPGDSLSADFMPKSGLADSCTLEWLVEDAPEQTIILSHRAFQWNAIGLHTVKFRVVGAWGNTSWDSIQANVVADAPTIDLTSSSAQPGRNTITIFTPVAKQKFGTFEGWGIDFDADTTNGWDLTGTGTFPEIRHLFANVGVTRILAYQVDDDGNRTVSYRDVTVKANNGVVSSSWPMRDTTVSIQDDVDLGLLVAFPTAGIQNEYQIEWRIDALDPDTTKILSNRKFQWNTPGNHVVRFRAIGPYGDASWDSVGVSVVQGAPVIRSITPSSNAVQTTVQFSVDVVDRYGKGMTAAWDFGDDGSWEVTALDPKLTAGHYVANATPIDIRVRVKDDDSNSVDYVYTFNPQNTAPVIELASLPASVGMTRDATLEVGVKDADGPNDLNMLLIDWNDDNQYDTSISVAGRSTLLQISHTWATPTASQNVKLMLTDKSNASVNASASIEVLANAPSFTELSEIKGRMGNTVARWNDELVFTVAVSDPTTAPADLSSLHWVVPGIIDTTMSLVGVSADRRSLRIPVGNLDLHELTITVTDLVGNSHDTTVSWTVEMRPPSVSGFLTVNGVWKTVLVGGEQAEVHLETLLPGLGGNVSASYAYKGGAWIPFTSQPGDATGDAFIVPNTLDSSWYITIRAEQDNGEVAYHTRYATVLESFTDPRNSNIYPVLELAGNRWLGRNLNWAGSGSSICPDQGCGVNGRLYQRPSRFDETTHDINGQSIWDMDSVQVQSACPDGWHIATNADWNALQMDVNDRGLDAAAGLRSVDGWGSTVPGQTDPLNFGAHYVTPYPAGATYGGWWSAPEPGSGDVGTSANWFQQSGDYFSLATHSRADASDYYPIRCVKNKNVMGTISSWGAPSSAVEGQNVYFPIHGMPIDSSPVTVTFTQGGVSTSKVISATELRFRSSNMEATLHGLGRQKATLEIVQGSSRWEESVWLQMKTPALVDSRDPLNVKTYTTAYIGTRVWMTQDLAYETGDAVVSPVIDPPTPGSTGQDASLHYPLATALGGATPSTDPDTYIQGICPDSWHIPTQNDALDLIAAGAANGLDATGSLRMGGGWFYQNPGTNDLGFNARPTGVYDGSAWVSTNMSYWTSTTTGSRQIPLIINAPYVVGNKRPYADAAYPAGSTDYLSVRCVKNP